MRVEISRRHKRNLGHGVALLIVSGLATGCSSGMSRFSTDDFVTNSTTSNQQSIIQPAQSAAAPQMDTYSAPVAQSAPVSRSALPPVASASPRAASPVAETASAPPPARSVEVAAVAPNKPAIDPLSRAVERNAEVKPKTPAKIASAEPAQPTKLPSQGEAPKNLAVLPAKPKVKESAAAQQTAAADTAKAKPAAKSKPGAYTVAEGDSLSRIARKHGVSVAALQAANGGSDALSIGQEIKIPAAGETVVAAKPAKVDPINTASTGGNQENPAKTEKPQLAAYTPPQKTKAIEAVESESDDAAPTSTGIGRMRWPAKGRVAKSRDGIDIQVPEGTAVKAAENGVVIYAGDGLKDFGNTVLVRHENGLVTVYGHASQLKVKRGQKVKRGEEIATSGMSGETAAPKLHFEVRKDSTPVDPSTYLE